MNTHRFLLIGAAAIVASPLFAVSTPGAPGRTLDLTITATKISTVDVPPLITSKTSPETPGDEVIAVSKVGGSATGRRYLVCTATATAPTVETARYACQVTYVLAHGTVT